MSAPAVLSTPLTTGDDAARVERLVTENLSVATTLSRRFRNRGIEDEDLRQVAHLALINAARRFDADHGSDFLSYAVPTIRGELRKHFRDRGWMVRPPRRVQELQSSLGKTQARLQQELGRPATSVELAEALEVPLQEVREAQSADGCFHAASLDRPAGSEDATDTVGERIADAGGDPHAHMEATMLLGPLVRELSERDRLVLQRRFYDDWTQRAIGEELGVSQMQVSRMLTRIMDQLRGGLGDAVPAAS